MARLGLRERKKLQMRSEIVTTAHRLFSERGFDDVTLPQVADEAGVSVKTIFNYFRLKEDLAFASEDDICAAWVACVRRRPIGTTPFGAVRDQVLDRLVDPASIGEVLAFQTLVDSSRVLVARQRMVWDRLETAVAQVLEHESSADAVSAPAARFAAAQVVNVLRLLYSTEMREYLEDRPPAEQAAALRAWMDEVLELVSGGLGDRFVRVAEPAGAAPSPSVAGATRVDPGSVPPRDNQPAHVERVQSPRVEALRVALASDAGALERFWTEVSATSTPLMEDAELTGSTIVTFLWQGNPGTSRVVVQANKLFRPDEPDASAMELLDGSNVWHLSYLLPSEWRGSYLFDVTDRSGATVRSDPLNPTRMPQPPGPEKSVASLPSAPMQRDWERRVGVDRGTISEHMFSSAVLGNERRIWCHEPAAATHDPSGELSVLVLLDGAVWAESLPVRWTFDNLLADGVIEPTLVLMVDSVEPGLRSRELACHDPFVTMLTDELLPWAANRWRCSTDRTRTTIVGQSLGGLAAAHAGLTAPETFGRVLSQSGSFWWRNGEFDGVGPEWLTGQVAGLSAAPLACYLEVGTDEGVNVAANHRMWDALDAAGHRLIGREFAGGHDRACWRGGLADGLIALAAADPAAQALSGSDAFRPAR